LDDSPPPPQDKMEAYSSYGHRLRHLGGP
jgi:hypothetical protein